MYGKPWRRSCHLPPCHHPTTSDDIVCHHDHDDAAAAADNNHQEQMSLYHSSSFHWQVQSESQMLLQNDMVACSKYKKRVFLSATDHACMYVHA